MTRAIMIILLSAGFFFQGCTAFKYMDGSPEEDIERFKASKKEIWADLQRAERENKELEKRIDILRRENRRIREDSKREVFKTREEKGLLSVEMKRLREEKERVSERNRELKEKLAELQQSLKAASSSKEPASVKEEKDIGDLKIKVLSGDGNLNSAKVTAKRLEREGYKIKLIDYAPRSNFSKNVVYFKPKYEREARNLLSFLDVDTITKPLSWASMYHIIVVTGR